MNATVLGRTDNKIFTKSEKKVSLMERFKEYFMENSAEIVSGMQALNGNPYAIKTYFMLKNDAVK